MGDNDEAVAAKYSIRCKHICYSSGIRAFDNTGLSWGFLEFLTLTNTLQKYLHEYGTLMIEVDIQITVDKDVWYPKLDIPNLSLSQLYESSEETSDVVFEVGGKEYHAHKAILSLRAKIIFELTRDYEKNDDDDDIKMVPIQDIEGDVFGSVLEFVYCVRTPQIEDKKIPPSNCFLQRIVSNVPILSFMLNQRSWKNFLKPTG
jgi:hypothetical protein